MPTSPSPYLQLTRIYKKPMISIITALRKRIPFLLKRDLLIIVCSISARRGFYGFNVGQELVFEPTII